MCAREELSFQNQGTTIKQQEETTTKRSHFRVALCHRSGCKSSGGIQRRHFGTFRGASGRKPVVLAPEEGGFLHAIAQTIAQVILELLRLTMGIKAEAHSEGQG